MEIDEVKEKVHHKEVENIFAKILAFQIQFVFMALNI